MESFECNERSEYCLHGRQWEAMGGEVSLYSTVLIDGFIYQLCDYVGDYVIIQEVRGE